MPIVQERAGSLPETRARLDAVANACAASMITLGRPGANPAAHILPAERPGRIRRCLQILRKAEQPREAARTELRKAQDQIAAQQIGLENSPQALPPGLEALLTSRVW